MPFDNAPRAAGSELKYRMYVDKVRQLTDFEALSTIC